MTSLNAYTPFGGNHGPSLASSEPYAFSQPGSFYAVPGYGGGQSSAPTHHRIPTPSTIPTAPNQPMFPRFPTQPNGTNFPTHRPLPNLPGVPGGFQIPGINPPTHVPRSTFSNPTFGFDAPDPSILRAPDGFFYAHTTQANNAHTPVLRSRDMTTWEVVGDAMPTTPAWVKQVPGNRTASDIWAPQVVQTGPSHYTMFFSGRDKNNVMRIGSAQANSPAGPFRPAAQPLNFTVGDGNGSMIDPNVLQTRDGRMYLYWGSANGRSSPGIYAQEIGMRSDGSVVPVGQRTVAKPKVASDRVLVEAPWVVERGGKYFMFYSDGTYTGKTQGDEYSLKVSVSNSPMGPFSQPRTILTANERFRGPGHGSVMTDDAGSDWVVYHARDRSTTGDRKLMMDRITWGPDGWPSVNGGRGPSSGTQAGPVVAARREPMRTWRDL